MSVTPEKNCQRCGLPAQAELCDLCFTLAPLDESLEGEIDALTGLPLPRGVETAEEIVVWSELAGIDRLVQFAGASLAESELDEWREKLLDPLCAFGGLDVVGAQVDLLSSWDELFSLTVDRFIVAYGENTSWLRAKKQSNFVKLNLLVGKLQELNGVDAAAERRESARLARQARELELRSLPPAVLPTGDPWRYRSPRGFEIFLSDSEFQALAKISQKIFLFAWRLASARVGSNGFWCKLGVAGCAKLFGTSPRTVKRARRQLKEGGWLWNVTQAKKDGSVYVARGSKVTGVARFEVASSPKHRRKVRK